MSFGPESKVHSKYLRPLWITDSPELRGSTGFSRIYVHLQYLHGSTWIYMNLHALTKFYMDSRGFL